MEVFVDPFYQGEILFPADCEARLSQLYGEPMKLQPEFVEAIAPKHFLARMLTNLKVIYLNRGEIAKALAAIERILLLFPNAIGERRDRGVIYYHLSRWIEANEDLQYYLDSNPNAEDAPMLRQLLERMSNDN
jgi:regulator of sirC expression with transglutaminase-like and TPR domain